jgi:hypothetical protein
MYLVQALRLVGYEELFCEHLEQDEQPRQLSKL